MSGNDIKKKNEKKKQKLVWSRIVCQIHAVSPESGRDSFSSLSLKAISDSVPSCLLFNHTLHSLSSAAVKLLIESPVWLQMTHFCLLFFLG